MNMHNIATQIILHPLAFSQKAVDSGYVRLTAVSQVLKRNGSECVVSETKHVSLINNQYSLLFSFSKKMKPRRIE